MAGELLVPLLFDAWAEIDRAVAGLTEDEALDNSNGSAIAWTYAHVAQQVDVWINVRFQAKTPHPYLDTPIFRIGGSGEAEDWKAAQNAVAEVRDEARLFLERASADDFARTIPYDGSFVFLRETGLRLDYALTRSITHHFFHIGEIATKRVALGHSVGDYPGRLEATFRFARDD